MEVDMKNAWLFLQWKWKNMDRWDRGALLAWICLFSSLVTPEPYSMVLNICALLIFTTGVSVLFYQIQSRSYVKYREEQQKIVEILKEDHK